MIESKIIVIRHRRSEICFYPTIAIDVNVIPESARRIFYDNYERSAADLNVIHCFQECKFVFTADRFILIWRLWKWELEFTEIATDVDKMCIVETQLDSAR